MSKKETLKKFLLVLLFVVTLIFTVIVTNRISIKYYQVYGRFNEDAKRVYKIPDKFISLKSLKEEITDKLSYMIGEGGIGFVDVDDIGIFYEKLSADWFIVRYKDEYYIRDIKYKELIYDASMILEQRNRIYNIGEAVILRGREIVPFVVTINSVETESEGKYARSTIKYTTNPNIPEFDSKTGWRRRTIFDRIETDKGTIITDFTFVDEETLQVKHPAGEKIRMIILKSPDYEGCIRKVIAD